MTKIISYYPESGYYKLPSSVVGSRSTTATIKGQPSPAHGGKDDCANFMLHLWVTVFMLISFIYPAFQTWSGHWACFAIHAILFLYSTLMLHLLIIKHHRDDKMKKPGLLADACDEKVSTDRPQLMSMSMLLATGIMLISLGVLVFVFRPDWHDLANIVLIISVATFLMLLSLKAWEYEKDQKALKTRLEVASDDLV